MIIKALSQMIIKALSQIEWVNSIPSPLTGEIIYISLPLDGGGLGWG